LQARGVRSIDVGCMQVNLYHHPQAFADLEQAFDPLANARYAGLFLRRLHAARQSWDLAAANYHSGNPERAEAYRLKVIAAWPAMAERLAEERRREALAQAWAAARPGTANGFQAMALSMAQQRPGLPMAHSLLRPQPAPQPAGARLMATRRGRPEELAEARR
jgi:phytoene dehydrogenase-like protein